jgi:PAS domain S-box-containing protein
MTNHALDAHLLAALLDAIPDAVIISHGDGTITRANAAAGKLFGYDPHDLIDTNVNGLMPQALADRHHGFMQNYLKTGKARIIGRGRVVEGIRRNGDTFPLHLSIGHADHSGTPFFVAILHDLSHRTAIEEALARSARLDAIGQMTGGINHDFSNLLTVIIGNLELLDARLENTDNRAMVADARDAAEMGADLTARLNAFARKSPTQTDPVDVNEACSAALSLIRRTFDPKFIISVQLGQDLPAIMADSTQLQSALINISLNARDAMPDGGKLILQSDVIAIDDTYIAQELDVAEGTYVRVTVTDTGRGMGPDTQQRVFEPFFTTKPIGHGTGLGLAMVYGFVRQCGGHVTIYSEIGRGTTIGLYFPVIDTVPKKHADLKQTTLTQRPRNQTVLVVEDNPHLRKLSVARVNELGYKVREADCGDTAAEILRNDPEIDAVFTDLVMPGELDGLALARHVVATYPHIRILLTSGYAEDILNKTADDHGHRLLSKPYRQLDLDHALDALF